MDNEPLLRKIRALLSKTEQSGCSPEEAANAAVMAQKLCDEHHITFAETATSAEFKADVMQDDYETGLNRIPTWMGHLCVQLCKSFEVKPITFGSKIRFYGMRLDVEAVKHLFEVLCTRLQIAAVIANLNYPEIHGRKFKGDFIIAAANQIGIRLSQQRNENARTLIIRKTEAVEDYLEEHDVTTKRRQVAHRDYSSAATHEGTKHGKTCQINPTIKDKEA